MGGFHASKIGVLASTYNNNGLILIWQQQTFFLHLWDLFTNFVPNFLSILMLLYTFMIWTKKRPCYLLCVSTHYFFLLGKNVLLLERESVKRKDSMWGDVLRKICISSCQKIEYFKSELVWKRI